MSTYKTIMQKKNGQRMATPLNLNGTLSPMFVQINGLDNISLEAGGRPNATLYKHDANLKTRHNTTPHT